MAVINDGTISLTNNSATITGVDTLFLSRAVKSGWLLYPQGFPDPFHVLVDATAETSLTVLETYNGPNQSGLSYELVKDFLDYEVPLLSPDMSESAYKTNYGHQKIIDALNSLGAAASHKQIINKNWIGVPVPSAFWGYQKFTGAVEISKLILSTNDDPTSYNLILDIEINGVLQGLNLTVLAGQKSIESSALTYIVQAGQVVRFKWITVNEPAGSNWNVDIHYKNSSSLRIYYDFQKMYVGTLYAGLVLGEAYKPASKGKKFGVTYELDDAPAGSGIILELLKDGASMGTPVTTTIPEGSLTGYLEFSQTEILTTNTCSLRVNQPGNVIPGSNLRTTLHSFHTT